MKSGKDDVAPLLTALEKFDEIFAVLKDDDGPKMKQVFDWASTEGREKDISAELREAVQSGQLSDADIEKKIAEMEDAPVMPATSRFPTLCARNSPPRASSSRIQRTVCAGEESSSCRW